MATTVLVVGSGLMGASVGLALRDAPEFEVLLHDQEGRALDQAVARGAGERWDGATPVDLAVIAVPPAATATTLFDLQSRGLATMLTHLCSVQSHVEREVQALGCDMSAIVGGHPLAGRELSGPGGASADLFAGRPWAVCPTPESTPAAVAAVWALAEGCGAVPLEVSAVDHDRAVAVLSHLPQAVSSALAALLADDAHEADEADDAHNAHNAQGLAASSHAAHASLAQVRTELSGGGLVDTTRLAAGDAALWTQIFAANAPRIAPAVRELASLLLTLAADLDGLSDASDDLRVRAEAGVRGLLERGNRGRARVPVKRGVRDDGFSVVEVEVEDRPGRLAALLTAAGETGVNVEDVHVDHLPGRPRGVMGLLVAADSAVQLDAGLRAAGWRVRGVLPTS